MLFYFFHITHPIKKSDIILQAAAHIAFSPSQLTVILFALYMGSNETEIWK